VEEGRRPRLKALLAISLACLLAQQAFTQYPEPGPGPHLLWLALGCLLLWLVYRRRSRAARDAFAALATFGAVIYALRWGDGISWAISALYLGQALPMFTRQVRDHVTAVSSVAAGLSRTTRDSPAAR
jgi:hypothetical protein